MKLDNKIRKYLPDSLWVFHINTGSCNACDIEILATLTPRYDVERFGIRLAGSPRHADVLLITGPLTDKMKDYTLRVYRQVPEPKLVIVAGNCGATGGVFDGSYASGERIESIMPVDLYVPGCPIRPEGLIYGITLAWAEIQKEVSA